VFDTLDDTSIDDRDTGSYTRQVLVHILICYVVYALDFSSIQHINNCCVYLYRQGTKSGNGHVI